MGKTATETFKDLSTTSLISLLAVALFLAGWRRWRRGVSPLRREPRQDGLGRQVSRKHLPYAGTD